MKIYSKEKFVKGVCIERNCNERASSDSGRLSSRSAPDF